MSTCASDNGALLPATLGVIVAALALLVPTGLRGGPEEPVRASVQPTGSLTSSASRSSSTRSAAWRTTASSGVAKTASSPIFRISP